jgi:hypothetical protein
MLRLRRGAGGCPRRSSAHPLGQSVAPLSRRASHLTGWHLPPGGDAHLAPARQGEQWASARLLPGAPGIRRASCRFKRRRSMRAPPLRPGRPPSSWALASADSSTASCSTKSFNGITCSPTPVTIRAQRRRPGGQHARRRVLPPRDLGLGRHGDAADAPRGAATRVGAAVARSRGDGTRPTGVATDQQTTPDIRSRPRQPARLLYGRSFRAPRANPHPPSGRPSTPGARPQPLGTADHSEGFAGGRQRTRRRGRCKMEPSTGSTSSTWSTWLVLTRTSGLAGLQRGEPPRDDPKGIPT